MTRSTFPASKFILLFNFTRYVSRKQKIIRGAKLIKCMKSYIKSRAWRVRVPQAILYIYLISPGTFPASKFIYKFNFTRYVSRKQIACRVCTARGWIREASHSLILKTNKMVQHLNLRCVLVSALWVLEPKHVSNPAYRPA